MIKKLVLGLALLVACNTTHAAPMVNTDAMCIDDASLEASVDASIEDAAPKHQNILIVGDSQAVAAKLQLKKVQKPNETIAVAAKGGTTIEWWDTDRFQNELNNHSNTDVVIIFLGTNNYGMQRMPAHQNILKAITARKVKCIWTGPTKVNGNKHIINKLIKNAVSNTCSYVDAEELNIPLSDGVHPTPQGATQWLQEIWKVKESL